MHLAGQPPSVSRRVMLEIALGAALIIGGAVTIAVMTDDSGYVIGGAPIFTGLIVVLHGMSGLAGYKSFVAWRYLLNHQQRVTRRTRRMIACGIVAYLAFYGVGMLTGDSLAFEHGFDPGNPLQSGLVATLVYLVIVLVIGVLRYSRPAM